MPVICKYQAWRSERFFAGAHFHLPYDAAKSKVVRVDWQDRFLTIWVEHDDHRVDWSADDPYATAITELIKRTTFVIVETGQRYSERLEYVGTVSDPDTGFVWHLMQEVQS